MTTPQRYPAWILAIVVMLLVMPWQTAHCEDGSQDFLGAATPQLSRNAAVLAGIAAEITNRADALAESSEERRIVEFAADELNDVSFMLMLGGELLGGSQLIEAEHRHDYYHHLVVVLDRTALQLASKLAYLTGLKDKIVDSRIDDDLSRAIGAIENSKKLLDQSAKKLNTKI